MTPARNRVTPTGDIEATALRGAWTGNRILHRGQEIVRFHASDLWITCTVSGSSAEPTAGACTRSHRPSCRTAPSRCSTGRPSSCHG